MNDVADVIDDIADYIEKHGWCQYAYQTDDGRVCLETALHHRGSILRYRVKDIFKNRIGHIIRYNDEPGRTEQEVLDFLRATAKDYR